jgi:hypothetical protein
VNKNTLNELKDFKQFLRNGRAGLEGKVKKGDLDQVIRVLEEMVFAASGSCLA